MEHVHSNMFDVLVVYLQKKDFWMLNIIALAQIVRKKINKTNLTLKENF